MYLGRGERNRKRKQGPTCVLARREMWGTRGMTVKRGGDLTFQTWCSKGGKKCFWGARGSTGVLKVPGQLVRSMTERAGNDSAG